MVSSSKYEHLLFFNCQVEQRNVCFLPKFTVGSHQLLYLLLLPQYQCSSTTLVLPVQCSSSNCGVFQGLKLFLMVRYSTDAQIDERQNAFVTQSSKQENALRQVPGEKEACGQGASRLQPRGAASLWGLGWSWGPCNPCLAPLWASQLEQIQWALGLGSRSFVVWYGALGRLGPCMVAWNVGDMSGRFGLHQLPFLKEANQPLVRTSKLSEDKHLKKKKNKTLTL